MMGLLRLRTRPTDECGPDAAETGPEVLLASVDGSFSRKAIAEAVSRSGPDGRVYVVSVARIHGTAFGFPHPALYPNKQERAEHRAAVAKAIRALEKSGITARGEVVATRHAARTLAGKARRRECEQIVVSARPRSRLGVLSWSNEPHRLAGKVRGIPVVVATT